MFVKMMNIPAVLSAVCLLNLSPFVCAENKEKKTSSAQNSNNFIIDPNLSAWMGQFVREAVPKKIDKEFIERKTKEADDVAKSVLLLNHLNQSEVIGYDSLGVIDNGLVALNEQLDLKPEKRHPLYPYLLSSLLQSDEINRDVKSWLYDKVRKDGDASCPQKNLLKKEIQSKSYGLSDEEKVKIYIASINTFQSITYRRSSAHELLKKSSAELRDKLKDDFGRLVKDFPELRDKFYEISEGDNDDEKNALNRESDRLFSRSKIDIAFGHCENAKAHFLREVAYTKENNRDEVEQQAIKIEQCSRHKTGKKKSVQFWESLQEPLTKELGFSGEEIVLRRIALLKWGKNDFDDAVTLLQKIRTRAQEINRVELEAQAVFTLGRIEENRNNIEKSIEYFKLFTEKYSDNIQYEDGLMSLVVLSILQNKDQEALSILNKVMSGDVKRQLGNEITLLSFAHYWAGRIYYKLGDVSKARDMWLKLSTDYTATFYGALGHYMVEKIDKKILEVNSPIAMKFDFEKLLERLKVNESRAAQRVSALAQIGLREDARCELSELSHDVQSNPDKDLTISLLRYAIGDWLLAVKRYSELPYDYRKNLPIGMDMILFPRAYEEEVKKYATKVNVDADFVFALIRQESVFNPRAMSPVGASGLMQLMPDTARRELKRIRSEYLSDHDRRQLVRTLNTQLFDPDSNIAIGVYHVGSLLKQFNNPVFMLSAYNANPSAAYRWMKNIDTKDIMIFIERIPYKETRAYVKLVMRNYFYYKKWYKGSAPELSLFDIFNPEKQSEAKAESIKISDELKVGKI